MSTMPRLTEWKALTPDRRWHRRGASMTRIDCALQDYWEVFDQFQGFNKPAMALIDLLQACNSWLKHKLNKPVPKSLFSSNGQKAYEKRKAAVTELANNVLFTFGMFVQDGLIGGDVKELRARNAYERHRFLFLKRGQRGAPSKPLDSGYAPEREAWLKSGKQSNVAGSLVHPLHGAIHRGDHADKGPSRKIRKIVRKDVNQLGLTDWLELKKFCVAHGIDSNDNNSAQCLYLARAERLCAMVYFDDQGKAFGYDEQSVTTRTLGSGTLYVMDRYGNLFVETNAIKQHGRYLNHSSMLSGNEVVCAGNIEVTHDRITLLNNNSGHYKPTKENLAECLQLLQADGADLSATKVVCKNYVGNQCWDLTWNTAAAFLTPGRAPDSTQQRH